jgi:hypothetical protein
MKGNRAFGSLMVATWLCLAAAPVLAQPDSPDVYRRKQQAQEKARALAVELIDAVLDVQLRQLEENGLKDRTIYKDIASMKGNIHALTKQEMEEIVQLLVQAQMGTQKDRLARFNQARAKIREVVVQLMAERQKLYRRMQIAKLAAQVRELIARQTRTRSITQSLPQRKLQERETMTLTTIEDQADVQKLFLVLVATLEDVSRWGGQIGAGASDGLRIVKAAQVDPELKRAATSLFKSEFSTAVEAQSKVIAGLKRLLEKLEETQGLIESDREAAVRMVREMMKKQEDLRDVTKQAELARPEVADELAEQQRKIHEELGKLAEALQKFESTQPLLEQAKAAAYEAPKELFQQQKEAALASQSEVIGVLAKVEQELIQGADLDKSGKSADELAQRVTQLQQAKQAVEAAAREQAQATRHAAQNPALAKQQEQKAAQELVKAEALPELPSVVDARLHDAQEKVAEAAKAQDNAAPEAAPTRTQKAEMAMDAIELAAAEIAAQLADAMRQQKAVEVGELARAAEAIERAAAAEREIARQASVAARNDGLEAAQAKGLHQEQKEVALVASKIAEGVKNTAPEASQMLNRAAGPMEEAQQSLAAAEQLPGEPSKASSQQAAKAAQAAARQLADAAKELRRQAGQSAEALAKIAGAQLAQAQAARQAVDAAAEAAHDDKAQAIAALQAAAAKLQQAQIAQARAEGREAAAQAQSLADEIAQAAKQQANADAAARDLAMGKANTPLQAAIEQQEVAETSEAISGKSKDAIAKAMQDAAQSAAEAAKETLAGNAMQAEAARAKTREALAAAIQAARQVAAEAAAAPPGQPDAKAQAQAGKAAAEASDLAMEAKSAAGQSAEEASQAASEASRQAANAARAVEAGMSKATRQAQNQAGQALDKAQQKVAEVLQNLAQEQAQALAERAQAAGRLAEQTVQVDPGTTAALELAQEAAMLGAQAADDAAQGSHAADAVKRNLERAAANLAAREQQLRRDRDIGEALAELAKQQQAAREAIAQAAEQLGEMPSDTGSGNSSIPAPSAQQRAAAQALRRATQEFSEAQRATGQGAVEVSGQTEVANVPIREGLKIASKLGDGSDQSMLAKAGQPAGQSQPMPARQSAAPSQAGAQAQPNSQGQPFGTPAQGQLGQQAQSAMPAEGQPSELGTGFVPQSPEVTAQQIAGSQALAQAAAVQASASETSAGQPQSEGQTAEGQSQQPMSGATSAKAAKGGVSQGGSKATNEKAPPGELELAPAAQGDSRSQTAGEDPEAAGRKFEDEPWFARLPPSLRSAIQSKARSKAPRGYEERLKRYFESVE